LSAVTNNFHDVGGQCRLDRGVAVDVPAPDLGEARQKPLALEQLDDQGDR
jgi:hypothetical protein